MDELTLAGPSLVAEARGSEVVGYEITPETFGLQRASKETLHGGDAPTNARLFKAVLQGQRGPHRDVVLFNAAPAIIAGERAEDWASGVQAAARAIDCGAAWAKFEALVRASHDS